MSSRSDRLLAFLHVQPFSPSRHLLRPLLTSSPASRHLAMSVALQAPMRISPGMTHPPSRLCPSDLRHSVPCKNRALAIRAASPRCAASYPLPVRQASALPSASFRFAVTHNTLAVRLTLPLAGRVEDFHLQASAPCRAHPELSRAAKRLRLERIVRPHSLLGYGVPLRPNHGDDLPAVVSANQVPHLAAPVFFFPSEQ